MVVTKGARLFLGRNRIVIAITTAFMVVACVAFDARTRLLALNTFFLAISVLVITLPLGSLWAVLISRTDAVLRTASGCIIAALLFVPLCLLTAGWDAGFGQQGWYGSTAIGRGLPLVGWRGAVWIHAVAAMPWVCLIVAVGLRRVPTELEEEALLSMRPLRVLRHVTLPGALPAIVAAAVWVTLVTATEITVTDVYQVRTFAEEVYTGFSMGETLQDSRSLDWPSVTVIVMLVGGTLLMCGSPSFLDRQEPWYRGQPFRLRQYRRPVGIGLFLLLLVLLGIPVVNLAYKAGVVVDMVGGQRVRNWSLLRCLEVVSASPWRFREEFAWSLLIAQLVAISAIVISVPLVWQARKGGGACLSSCFGCRIRFGSSRANCRTGGCQMVFFDNL